PAPEDRVPLLRAEGALARAVADRILGPQRAAARRLRRQDPVARGREDRARLARPVLARAGRHRPAVLREALDRRAGAPRQGAGGVRAPDSALGPSVPVAELPGQDARRDDPGARAWPRRAPGAGRAARPADGRYA